MIRVWIAPASADDGLALHVARWRPAAGPISEQDWSIWSGQVRGEDDWRAIQDILFQHAEFLSNEELLKEAGRGKDATVLLTFQMPPPSQTLELAGQKLVLSREAQRWFQFDRKSNPTTRGSVLIIHEPHHDLKRHWNLFEGLRVLFADNPTLLEDGKTVLLAEGFPTGERVDLQPLIRTEPDPDDELLRRIMGTFLITGYMAYEWRWQNGLVIMGSEDPILHGLCARRHAAHWQKLRQRRLPQSNPFFTIDRLTGFVTQARNQAIAKTLIDLIKDGKTPILFVGGGHIGPYGSVQEYPTGFWNPYAGELTAEELACLRRTLRGGIADFLRNEQIGFCSLQIRTTPMIEGDSGDAVLANRYFLLHAAQADGDIEEYTRQSMNWAGSCTVRPSPHDAATVVAALYAATAGEGNDSSAEQGLDGRPPSPVTRSPVTRSPVTRSPVTRSPVTPYPAATEAASLRCRSETGSRSNAVDCWGRRAKTSASTQSESLR